MVTRLTWHPAVEDRHEYGAWRKPPTVGQLIAVNRKPWRVLEVRDHDDPDIAYELILDPLDGGRHHGARVPTGAYLAWHPLPEHFAVCHSCGELAPCHEHENSLYAAEQAKRMDRELQLLPGCCPACQEPVTARQRTIEFPGEYVRNPLAPPDPVFHLRRRCRSQAAQYEDKWVRADPTRQRSLLTLRCTGTIVVHADGDVECHGDAACPSIYARHGVYTICHYQHADGCPRGCSPGVWSCTPKGRPKNPRDLTR